MFKYFDKYYESPRHLHIYYENFWDSVFCQEVRVIAMKCTVCRLDTKFRDPKYRNKIYFFNFICEIVILFHAILTKFHKRLSRNIEKLNIRETKGNCLKKLK
jgi:hypothetical protein